MKKVFLILVAFAATLQLKAQNINPENDHVQQSSAPAAPCAYRCDAVLSNWVIDVNAFAGGLTQNITSNATANNYLNAVNTNVSDVRFDNSLSYGFDAQVGYFFNHSRHFGIGTGILYMYQQGNVTMDNFHVEYQSTDHFGSTFRQLITANGQIKESINTSNFNIPILLKYKTRFCKGVGFTADAGLLINLQENTDYSSNASFDYEAIYDYVGPAGSVSTVYDNSPIPGASDLLITKTFYQTAHPTGNVQNYFNTLQSYGYNVGLGVKPNNNSGNVSYMTGSLGFLVRPAVSFYLSENIALNLGVYYIYQNFKNSSSSNSMLTDKVGDYNSVLGGVSKSVNNNYGVSLGLRFYLGHTARVVVPEPAPLPVEEEKPVAVEPPQPAKEEEEETPEMVDISTPILFDLNKTSINPIYYPLLEEAAKEVNQSKTLNLIIHGYADNTGNSMYNLALSKRRANMVKSYLQKNGVSSKKLKTVAHGEKSPAASNKTAEGRLKNRRVVLKLKDTKK